jgi:hypothetical protein
MEGWYQLLCRDIEFISGSPVFPESYERLEV